MYAVYISVLFKKSVTYYFVKIKLYFMHHYNGDTLIFILAYSIKFLRGCRWSYEWIFITYWTHLVAELEVYILVRFLIYIHI